MMNIDLQDKGYCRVYGLPATKDLSTLSRELLETSLFQQARVNYLQRALWPEEWMRLKYRLVKSELLGPISSTGHRSRCTFHVQGAQIEVIETIYRPVSRFTETGPLLMSIGKCVSRELWTPKKIGPSVVYTAQRQTIEEGPCSLSSTQGSDLRTG